MHIQYFSFYFCDILLQKIWAIYFFFSKKNDNNKYISLYKLDYAAVTNNSKNISGLKWQKIVSCSTNNIWTAQSGWWAQLYIILIQRHSVK